MSTECEGFCNFQVEKLATSPYGTQSCLLGRKVLRSKAPAGLSPRDPVASGKACPEHAVVLHLPLRA